MFSELNCDHTLQRHIALFEYILFHTIKLILEEILNFQMAKRTFNQLM